MSVMVDVKQARETWWNAMQALKGAEEAGGCPVDEWWRLFQAEMDDHAAYVAARKDDTA